MADEARSLQYSISVSADTGQAESNIRSLTSSLGDMQSARISVDADTSGAESSLRRVTSGLGEVQSDADSAGSAFRKSFLAGIDSGDSFASSLKQGVGGAFSYVKTEASEMKTNVVNAANNIKEGFTHPIETIKTGLGNAIQTAKDKFTGMVRSADEAADAAAGLGDSSEDAAKGIDEAGDAAERSEGKFGGFGKVLKGVGVALAAATVAVGGFALSSVNVGMQFDSSMSQVAATMGYSVEELNTAGSEAAETYSTLRNFAMEMGASTAFSATEAADALNYMALAGYDAETSMSMLPTVLNLAAAGGIDLAAASDMVTDAQSALGLTLDETTEMVDKMAAASSKSNTSVEQLGNAFLTVGGTAKNLAGGTTELATMLGVLADNGVKGSEGGTALRNVILSLSAPTDTAAKAISNLGLEVFDAEGNMRPLNETFGDLQNILSTMTQQEQTEVLNTIFNKTDLKSVNALLGTSAERFEELSSAIDNSSGAAENMANVQLDNLAGDITLFKSALEGAQIVISDQLSPTLREFVQFGSSAVSELSTAFQEGGLSGAMGALGTILSDGLAMVIEKLPSLVDAGMQLIGALGQGIIDNLPMVTQAAAEIIVTLASGIGEALPEMIPSIVEALILVGETIIENLPLILEAGMSIVSGLIEGIVEAIPLLVEALPELILSFVNFVSENLPTILEQGTQLLLTLAMGIVDAIPQLVAQLPTIITSIVDFVTSNLPLIVETGISIIVQLAIGIVQAIPQLVASLPQIISAIVGGLASLPGMMLDIGKSVVTGLWNGISSMASWVLEKVKGFGSSILSGIKGILGIHSPSTAFRDEVGKNMALGLGEGFTSEMGKVEKDIEKSIPTEFDLPSVNAPDVNAGVTDMAYKVSPIVEAANVPYVSDITYGVTPIVGDFNPPNTSTPEDEVDEDDPKGKVPDPDTGGGTPPPTFAPVIQITVNGNADDETVENLRTSLRDEVRELFREFREEELERQSLKNQYAFG